MKNEEQGVNIRENFCGACIAIPLALVGAGTSVYSASSKKKYKTQKKVIFWTGIAITLISLLIIVYFVWIKKCKDCE